MESGQICGEAVVNPGSSGSLGRSVATMFGCIIRVINVDHPYFQGETINICRTTNQVYQSELEYEMNWKLKDQNSKESNDDIYYSE
ncbi:unnamed protein product [Rotaria socialis]